MISEVLLGVGWGLVGAGIGWWLADRTARWLLPWLDRKWPRWWAWPAEPAPPQFSTLEHQLRELHAAGQAVWGAILASPPGRLLVRCAEELDRVFGARP